GTDLAEEVPASRSERLALDQNVAGIGCQQSEEQADRRCLAGAVRAEEAVDGSAADAQVEVANRHPGPERACQAGWLDRQGRRHGDGAVERRTPRTAAAAAAISTALLRAHDRMLALPKMPPARALKSGAAYDSASSPQAMTLAATPTMAPARISRTSRI